MKKRLFLGLVVVLLSALTVQAQEPVQPSSRVISFNGTIPGQPDGAVALRFRIFAGPAGGTPLFEETQTRNVTGERFTAFIGDGTGGGIPTSIFEGNPSLWIAFSLDTSPDVELGARLPITSAGFTHFAPGTGGGGVTSVTAGDSLERSGTSTDVILGVANLGITNAKLGASSVTSEKIAANAVRSPEIEDGSIGAADVNTLEVQRRVGGTCPDGSAIQIINPDGTVSCGGAVAAVTASLPLVASGGPTPNISLPHVHIEAVPGPNTAVGINAFLTRTGQFNTAIGRGALQNNFGSRNTATGDNALNRNTSGQFNTAIGDSALTLNTEGGNNTAVGAGALASNVRGNFNTAVGDRALENNTGGSNNTAFGSGAGRNNTATGNSFFGAGAGRDNTTGNLNAFFGNGAGARNTTGSFNSFFGQNAGGGNLAASENSFFGYNAGQDNITGTENSFFGAGAGTRNTTGSFNSFFGDNAGVANRTGRENSFFGDDAGQANTTGSFNSFFGQGAGQANESGSFNTAVGRSALLSNTTGNGNIAVGYLALQFNNTGGANVAIGGDALRENRVSLFNTAVGSGALQDSTACCNTAVGHNALRSVTTGTNNTGIGDGADVQGLGIERATAIGAGARVAQSNSVVIGSHNVRVGIGNVPTPLHALQFENGAHVTTGGSFVGASDKDKKENFAPVNGEETLEKIVRLPVSSWNFKSESDQIRHIGPTAQDFRAAFGLGQDDKTIATTDLSGVALVAIQELEKQSSALKEEVKTLRSENADLKARLEALERLLLRRGARAQK